MQNAAKTVFYVVTKSAERHLDIIRTFDTRAGAFVHACQVVADQHESISDLIVRIGEFMSVEETVFFGKDQ